MIKKIIILYILCEIFQNRRNKNLIFVLLHKLICCELIVNFMKLLINYQFLRN